LIVALTLSAGCRHWDVRPGGNPGHVDLTQPPNPLGRRGLAPADDPGERLLVVSPGVFSGVGKRSSGAAGAELALAAEVSVHAGWSAQSHRHESSQTVELPERSLALNLGYSAAFRHGDRYGDTFYLEGQYSQRGWGVAAGPAWSPAPGAVGGQLTAFLGFLYTRASLIEGVTTWQAGLFVKAPLTWVWSR
jgi:hypothetical protein